MNTNNIPKPMCTYHKTICWPDSLNNPSHPFPFVHFPFLPLFSLQILALNQVLAAVSWVVHRVEPLHPGSEALQKSIFHSVFKEHKIFLMYICQSITNATFTEIEYDAIIHWQWLGNGFIWVPQNRVLPRNDNHFIP